MRNIRSSRFFDLCWSFLATSHIATAQDQGGFGFTDNHYGLSDLEIHLGVNGSREFTEGLFAKPDPKIPVYQTNISNFGQQTILDVVNRTIPIPYWNATINGAIDYLDNMFKKNSTTEYDPIIEDGTPKSFCFKPKRSPTGPPRPRERSMLVHPHLFSKQHRQIRSFLFAIAPRRGRLRPSRVLPAPSEMG